MTKWLMKMQTHSLQEGYRKKNFKEQRERSVWFKNKSRSRPKSEGRLLPREEQANEERFPICMSSGSRNPTKTRWILIQVWTLPGNSNPKMLEDRWLKWSNLKDRCKITESKSRMKKCQESRETFSQTFANVFKPIIQIDRKKKRINRVMIMKTDSMKYNSWMTTTLMFWNKQSSNQPVTITDIFN